MKDEPWSSVIANGLLLLVVVAIFIAWTAVR